jgi:hypothetical protein
MYMFEECDARFRASIFWSAPKTPMCLKRRWAAIIRDFALRLS